MSIYAVNRITAGDIEASHDGNFRAISGALKIGQHVLRICEGIGEAVCAVLADAGVAEVVAVGVGVAGLGAGLVGECLAA
ncbi:hypothetical protein ACG83_38355, partial [Frankia sp. R43]|uniref:hypothetical protein n=1 Tax=Frankia sp. R43 TaxID=269536 RepID=UPI0006DA620F